MQELYIDPRESPEEQGSIPVSTNDSNSVRIAAVKMAADLIHNRTLRHLRFTVANFSATDEWIWYITFALTLSNHIPLETLTCGRLSNYHNFPSYLYPYLERVGEALVGKLKTNQNLHSIRGRFLNNMPQANDLDLNKFNARRIVSDRHSSISEWLDSVTRASKEHKLNAVYYLIRNKPEVCKM